ncbi:Imidazolonepropionase [Actinopolyspora xinjiangensis]|uniref:Imidazolonepropionase n=1 Tax=Actinopolyspora xinjiangensis TaxID=405564 RepID=A0A1H0RPF7_9ACTN|nr:amidohydrolase family protein [Actinopolyspora xinjiangensis]SDP30846.1 Imidazolonepropionase [Actinopolyspora xinjiangensis]
MRLLVSAERMWTGTTEHLVEDGAVLVERGLITAVGPRAELAESAPDAHAYDFPGHTILPGLINAHVHLSLDAGAEPINTLLASEDDELLNGMAERAEQALDAGTTTVRDLGDRNGTAIRIRDAVARGELTGPRILAAGPPLTVHGGHCWFLGGEVERDENSLRRAVARRAELGADTVKVMASGGQITPNSPAMWQSQFSGDELRVIVDESRRHGLPVAAHAHGSDAITDAVAAGVTTVEHCTWLGPDGMDEREPVIRAMRDSGIRVCAGQSRNWHGLGAVVGEDLARRFHRRLSNLVEAGVGVIIGTDAGLRDSVFHDFAGALGLYEHLGFDNERILRMATSEAAEALGLGRLTGRVVPGLRADLVVVRGDPLARLSDLGEVALTIANGTPHHPRAAA